jgi:broad specificity phosphatase PhoE
VGDGEATHRIVVVRHGETEWSAALRHTSRTDVALTPQGRRQAERIGERLAGHRFASVLVSPRRRALETCELAGFGAHARVDPRLVEWDYGDYEGRTTAEIRAERPSWFLWRDGAPNGESPADVGRRADLVLEDVRQVRGDVVVFAHGHLLRVLAARFVGLSPAEGRVLALDPGALGVLGYERGTPALLRWNDDGGDPLGEHPTELRSARARPGAPVPGVPHGGSGRGQAG